MPEQRSTGVPPAADERAIARKYGIRELNPPDSDQLRALALFLTSSLEAGRCAAVPRTAALVTYEFLHATAIRQHITKGPGMSTAEYDALQAPYYTAARIIAKLQRARQESAPGALYQTTWISLSRFTALLHELLEPSTPWLRARSLPPEVCVAMGALREFLDELPQQRRRER